MAYHFTLWTGKAGHSLNCSSSLSQKWLPGTNGGRPQPQSSAPATQWPFISSSYFLNSEDMMNSDLALTSSIFIILFQIPHRSEDSSDSGKNFLKTFSPPESSFSYTSCFSHITIIIRIYEINFYKTNKPSVHISSLTPVLISLACNLPSFLSLFGIIS